jgi:hypothetical protein
LPRFSFDYAITPYAITELIDYFDAIFDITPLITLMPLIFAIFFSSDICHAIIGDIAAMLFSPALPLFRC